MITQDPNESRLEYLLRVAVKFAQDNGSSTIGYDENRCDGYCLADDLTNELEDLKFARENGADLKSKKGVKL